MTNTNAYLPGTNIPTAEECRRLDDLTAYNSTILGHLTGEDLDRALEGVVARQPHPRAFRRTDESMRTTALNEEHPDDLAAALVRNGFSLARVGIESIKAVR